VWRRWLATLTISGMIIAGLLWFELTPQKPTSQAPQAGQERAENHGANIARPETADDRIARYTWWLAAFTAALVTVSAIQIFFLIRADKTARRSADAALASTTVLPRIERAYVSVLGAAYNGVIDIIGGRSHVTRLPAGPPNIFEVMVNNYGKTPAELIEVRVGFLPNKYFPPAPPPVRPDRIFYLNFWLSPDTRNHTVQLVPIGEERSAAVYARIYYRDIVLGKRHSSGFVCEISDAYGAQPVRAPRAYSEERDEPDEPDYPVK